MRFSLTIILKENKIYSTKTKMRSHERKVSNGKVKEIRRQKEAFCNRQFGKILSDYVNEKSAKFVLHKRKDV